jgi:hypothetical protein
MRGGTCKKMFNLNTNLKQQGVVAHVCNPSTQHAEAGRSQVQAGLGSVRDLVSNKQKIKRLAVAQAA